MDSPHGNSNSLPPFLTKTYDMVDDPSSNNIVSWSLSNSSFVVRNPLEFAKELLPKYFKHNNFSSFVRQLNTYGFHKVDPDQWEFANDDFVKGQRNRLKNIHRRKPMFSHSSQTQPSMVGAQAETERRELQEEIDKLKLNKGALLSEIQMHAEKKQDIDQKMQYLEEKLQVLEDRQKHLITYLSQFVSIPGFISKFLGRSEQVHKRRRHEDVDMVESTGLDTEPFDRIESSLNSLENFFRGVSEAYGEEDMYYDRIAPSVPTSGVVLTELNASSEEANGPNLAESTSRSESPVVAIAEVAATPDVRNKVSEIDMNSEPTAAEVESSQVENQNRNTGQNDLFWQQFLTDQPGSNEEVQSERRDPVDPRNEREGFWLNRKNVENLTEKIGHLASLEKT
ncbi:heat stress transcription factor A-4b-like protein [Carex littledalei]|uniref:Heat stress transcription factor A-4b-like protein n=1 Tax=Carex littledalei TaxID=544730 RepID=A0A833QCS3_9POAL|nr:heat stress transcription factor A-4b-like protein [Carex littledalei]